MATELNISKLKFLVIDDPKLIHYLLEKEDFYKNVLNIPNLEKANPTKMNLLWFTALHDKDPVGLCVLQPQTDNSACFHAGIYKKFRHQHTVQLLTWTLEQIQKITNVTLWTMIRSDNYPALNTVQKIGFSKTGEIKNGYKGADLLIFGRE